MGSHFHTALFHLKVTAFVASLTEMPSLDKVVRRATLTVDAASFEDAAEQVFIRTQNVGPECQGYRSTSVGDIILVRNDEECRGYQVDSIGFRPIKLS